jgi:bile acid:Na+ symporter, BASS family
MDIRQLISLIFEVSMMVTVFGFGLSAKAEDLLYLFHRPRLLVVSLLAMFIVMPVAALAVELAFDFPHAARVALVVLALSPIPQLLPRTEISSGGRASYAYGLAFSVALLSIVIVPALVHFLGRVMGRPFGLPPFTVAEALVRTVLAPLAVGLAVQHFLPAVAGRIREPMVRVANLVLSVAVVLLLIVVLPALLGVIGVGTLFAMSLFIVVGLMVGHCMGGPKPDHAVVLAIACANRNPGIAISIAVANFPAENFGATIVLYAILVGIVSKPYIDWQKRRLTTTRQSGESVTQGT